MNNPLTPKKLDHWRTNSGSCHVAQSDLLALVDAQDRLAALEKENQSYRALFHSLAFDTCDFCEHRSALVGGSSSQDFCCLKDASACWRGRQCGNGKFSPRTAV